ncbi:MAG: EAL domain-containing protein [Bacilli bacterium]|nr:EAL domain-containing protein [Bacilli bacterium]
MYFIIYFDIASIVILLFLIIGLVFRRQFDSRNNKLYLVVILVTLATALFDVLASLDFIPVAALTILNSFYFICRSGITFTMFLYLLSLTNLWNYNFKSKIRQLIVFAPVFAVLILLIINFFTKSVFYYADDKSYYRESLINIIYAINYIYGAICIVLTIIRRKTLLNFKFVAVLAAITLQIGAAAAQFFVGSLLIEIFSCTCSLLILNTFVERPEDYLEYITQMYNTNVFNKYVRDKIELNKPFNVIIIRVANLIRIFSVFKYGEALTLIRDFGFQLTSKTKEIDSTAHSYYINQGIFIIAYSKAEKTEELMNFLKGFLVKDLKNDDLAFLLQTQLCYANYPNDFADRKALLNFANSFHNMIDFKNEQLEVANEIDGKNINLLFSLEQILDEAIKNKTFEMYYQPILDTRINKFTSAEALIRLKNDKYGLISPGIFIPYAERSGRILEIGEIILEKCFEFAASDEFKNSGLQTIEINLSILQLQNENLISHINELVEKYQIDRSIINFELTETIAINHDKVIENNIYELAKNGYTLSLDDFGVGYSNLARLFNLPFKIIKIDKMIVDQVETKEIHTIIENLIKIIAESSLEIVAEGVETKEKVQAILDLGIGHIQGFYYSRPIPKNELIEFLKKY